MLDLEKKVDKKFLEAHHETASAIVNAFDISLFKKDIEESLNHSIQDIESKIDNVFFERVNTVEDTQDKHSQSLKELIQAFSEQEAKVDQATNNL